jgi:hypothetical protein
MRFCAKAFAGTGFAILAILWALTSSAGAQTPASNTILFILDGSGSMWEQIDGQPKIATAKAVMLNILGKLPPTAAVTLAPPGGNDMVPSSVAYGVIQSVRDSLYMAQRHYCLDMEAKLDARVAQLGVSNADEAIVKEFAGLECWTGTYIRNKAILLLSQDLAKLKIKNGPREVI